MSSYLSGHIVPLPPSERPTNVDHLVKQSSEPQVGPDRSDRAADRFTSIDHPPIGHVTRRTWAVLDRPREIKNLKSRNHQIFKNFFPIKIIMLQKITY